MSQYTIGSYLRLSLENRRKKELMQQRLKKLDVCFQFNEPIDEHII